MNLHTPKTTSEAGFSQLPRSARVWIYGAGRALTRAEVASLERHMRAFLEEWRSHGREITPGWGLVHDQFLVIGVDERAMGISGCSIDSMFRAVEGFRNAGGVEFSRSGNQVWYRDARNEVRCLDRSAFSDLARQGALDAETIVFDNTVSTLAELDRGRWEVPMRESWHMKAFGKFLPQRT